MKKDKEERSRENNGAYSNATKGIAKEAEKSWERESGTHGQATRSIVRGVEKKSSVKEYSRNGLDH